MTAVMRAAHVATGPRVLRIGVVRGGRIVEERVIKSRATVTIGVSERAMFLVDETRADMGEVFPLFERAGDGYRLNVARGMHGRVALEGGVVDLACSDAPRSLTLTDDARGKVVHGALTLLFQFVAPPPAAPRPELPLSVKGGFAARIDWNLTIVAAFSFLVHFGFVGAMLSDWLDPVLADDISVTGLVDGTKAVAPPYVETAKAPSDVAPVTQDPAPRTPERVASRRNVIETPTRPPFDGSERQATALAARAARIEVELLGAFTGGPALAATLRGSDVPAPDLSDAARSASGVSQTGKEIQTASGVVVKPGAEARGLDRIAVAHSASRGAAGGESAVRGPTSEAHVGAPAMSVPIGNAESVVAGLKSKFRRCYDKGLLVNPVMSGAVIISAKVSPSGEVLSADARDNTGLDADVVACLQRAVRGASFAAPGGTGSTLNIPVKLVQQSR